MRRSTLFAVLVAGSAVVLIAAACGDDEAKNADPFVQPYGDSASATDGSPVVVGAEDGSTPPAAPLPSFCDGLVLYASFDAVLGADVGGGDPLAIGSVSLSAQGKFGGAASFASNAAVADGGAALYFVRADGGPPVYPDNEGTAAVWVRAPLLDRTVTDVGSAPAILRPVASLPPAALEPSGLTLLAFRSSLPTRLGLAHTPTGSATVFLHLFQDDELRPYLRAGDYNHLVTAWRRGNAGGAPTAYLAINGGLGERFGDSGVDDPYKDATANEAGALRVPYRGYTSQTWDYPDASTQALRLGSPSESNVAVGDFDDVAIWRRVLSFDEIADVYRAGMSLKQACRL